MAETTGLTNPDLSFHNVKVPVNFFRLEKREIKTVNGVSIVNFYLTCFTEIGESESLPVVGLKFDLKNMPSSPTIPEYWQALFDQYGSQPMPGFDDGVLINKYTKLTD